jgi:hypothetical protein
VNARSRARVWSAIILGVVLGLDLHYRGASRHEMGKPAFLDSQDRYFDRMYAKPSSVVMGIVAGMVLAGTVFGGYELLALGIYSIIKRKSDNDGT